MRAFFACGSAVALVVVAACHDLGSYQPAQSAGGAASYPNEGGADGGSRRVSEPAAGAAGAITAGEAGAGEQGGSAGRTEPVAGAGHASDSGGSGGAGDEETLVPDCLTISGYLPAQLDFPSALAATTIWSGDAFVLFASDTGANAVRIAWQTAPGAEIWTGWRCFDAVRHPTRLASRTFDDGTTEVFATTLEGGLLVRRQFPSLGDWTHWMSVEAPSPTSRITDVALEASDGFKQLYVIDRGHLFRRTGENDEARGSYGAWRDLGFVGGEHVRVGLAPDGRHQLLTNTEDGAYRYTIQKNTGPEAPFDSWEKVPAESETLVDVTFGYDAEGRSTLYAIDERGALLFRSWELAASGDWSDWAGPRPPAPLVSVSAAQNIEGTPAFLIAAIGVDGIVYFTEAGSPSESSANESDFGPWRALH